MHFASYSSLAITCPPIPIWDDMEANSTDNIIGAFVNVSCSRDKMRHFAVSVCTEDGEWDPPLDKCKSKMLYFIW